MKKIKLSQVMLYEVIVGIIIIAFIMICVGERPREETILTEYPITYTQPVEKSVEQVTKPSLTEIAKQEMQLKMNEFKHIEDKKGWFISYKNIIDKYSDVVDTPETIYDYYTEEEVFLMQRVVETECYGGDFNSKVNVSCVILNQINSDEFGSSVKEVITAPNQFTYWRKTISDDTKLAIEYAFAIEDTTNGCIAFHSNKKRNKFHDWSYAFTDSIGHNFYY